MVADSSAIEECSNSPDDIHSNVVIDGLGGINFDNDGDKCKVQIFDMLDDKEQNLS